MTEETIHYKSEGRIATITINRPDKAHAFNISMLQSLYKKLEQADNDDRIKCIIIKSTGDRFFSAGYDLKEIQGAPENVKKITEWGRKVNYRILTLKKIVISQIQGRAIGFGVLMILASDLRVFADRPKEELYIHLPELAISAFPQTGATLLPLLAFGLSYAKHLLYTADRVGLEELKNINFPDRIFALEELEEATVSFAKQIAKYQNPFLFLPKAMLNIMNKNYIEACMDLEDECGKMAYTKGVNVKELDEFIKEIYKNYP
ncbi:MAG: putative 3-hydroxypropionyl-coenzyme A dehydratase [Promethearchaeota archaeon]|nr:MAG: putative 3-hydroxypropionyl-coenzyme A dehydratase [Candidatus Lokiarchaeota archaeon]